MKKIRLTAVILMALMFAGICSGCVKIIPEGTESEYTGEAGFDAGAAAADDWSAVQQEIMAGAEALSALKNAPAGSSCPVSFAGTVAEYNTDSPKGYLVVEPESGEAAVQVQVGKVYSGTAVRDTQTGKTYEDFTNQTEWSAYAKTLNDEVQANVVDPLGELSQLVGGRVEVIGCAVASGDIVTVTPVSITVQ